MQYLKNNRSSANSITIDIKFDPLSGFFGFFFSVTKILKAIKALLGLLVGSVILLAFSVIALLMVEIVSMR